LTAESESAAPGGAPPAHPTMKAFVLIAIVTVLLIALAAFSTLGPR
jgi:hypothetical protein